MRVENTSKKGLSHLAFYTPLLFPVKSDQSDHRSGKALAHKENNVIRPSKQV